MKNKVAGIELRSKKGKVAAQTKELGASGGGRNPLFGYFDRRKCRICGRTATRYVAYHNEIKRLNGCLCDSPACAIAHRKEAIGV